MTLKYVPKCAHILKHKDVYFNIGVTYLLCQSVQNNSPAPMSCTAEQGPMSKQHAPVRVDAQYGSCQAELELTALNDDCLLKLINVYNSMKQMSFDVFHKNV